MFRLFSLRNATLSTLDYTESTDWIIVHHELQKGVEGSGRGLI
jgi:hypothetical protein